MNLTLTYDQDKERETGRPYLSKNGQWIGITWAPPRDRDGTIMVLLCPILERISAMSHYIYYPLDGVHPGNTWSHDNRFEGLNLVAEIARFEANELMKINYWKIS